jgi:Photosynthetic reaction centre cytochrome C subunit
MIRFRFGVVALGVVVLASSVMAAQAPAGAPPAGGGQRAAGPPPAPPKNLQVLPKDMPAAQVVAMMRNFTTALGVQCGYCHVFEGAGNPANDMAADTKTPKLVARVMMQMVGDINQKLAANIKKPADQLTSVGCMTCHRGQAIPTIPPPAPPPGRRGGAPEGAAPPATPPAEGK